MNGIPKLTNALEKSVNREICYDPGCGRPAIERCQTCDKPFCEMHGDGKNRLCQDEKDQG